VGFGVVDDLAEQFLADCRARARGEEIFEQSYMCNPLGTASDHLVEWSAIERCRADYQIERLHVEADEVRQRFGEFSRREKERREEQIGVFLRGAFPKLFGTKKKAGDGEGQNRPKFRLGFDVAASGQGDLAAIYLDEAKGDELWLRALLTCRTEDWHFLKTILFYFLEKLPGVQAAGDESGLGRQICWEAAKQHPGRFLKVNFASEKHDLGFSLMNQLSVAEKRFPKSEPDIAADYFALRKVHTGTRWAFSEGRNTLNTASHCDIAWAGALATFEGEMAGAQAMLTERVAVARQLMAATERVCTGIASGLGRRGTTRSTMCK
jgi:phage FluMu gp28-like protein